MPLFLPIADDIWMVDGDIVKFHGFAYPTRSVIVRLRDESLWVWSPTELTERLRREIETIGRPAHLVSPNKLHHLYLRDWHAAFPDAELWAPASTIRKRRDLLFQSPLVDRPPVAWAEQIDQCWVRGSFAMDEIVFFHIPSRTAILADLSENFSSKWLSEHWRPWQRPLARLSKIVEDKGYAPLDWRLTFIRGKTLRQAKAKILSWEPLKVIMAHGEWQSEGGREFLNRAFGWIG
ncbi:DUF4336 domain-containing protein [Bradyrhizobium sp. UFLA05-109]